MGTHGTSRNLTLPACSRSPPQLSFSPPLSKVANAMSPGGGRARDGGGDGSKKPPPPLSKVANAMSPGGGRARDGGGDGSKKPPPPTPGPGAHPRYIPKRGSVLKGIVRGVLGRISTHGAPANSGGHRVRPAPPGEAGGDDGAEHEQGK